MQGNPKRRKYRDNPYEIYTLNNKHLIRFKDSKNNIQEIEITNEVYELFNNAELHDLKELNEYDRHIEHSELLETTLYKRLFADYYSLENEIEEKILVESVKKEIDNLPNIQKRRLLKHFFEEKTFEEIAKEEQCTKRAIKFSVDIAIEKISKKFKD